MAAYHSLIVLQTRGTRQRELTKIMNVEQVLEEWSDIEEESE